MAPAHQRLHRRRGVMNGVTIVTLLAFIVGVFYYNLHAIGQDDFTDVDVAGNPREKVRDYK